MTYERGVCPTCGQHYADTEFFDTGLHGLMFDMWSVGELSEIEKESALESWRLYGPGEAL